MMITTKQSHSAPVQRCHLSMSLIAAYMLCKMNSVGRGSERLATKRGYLSLVPSRPMICRFQRKRNEQQVHENVALGVRKLNLKWPDAVVGNPCRGGKNLGVGACKMPSAQGVAPSRAQKKKALQLCKRLCQAPISLLVVVPRTTARLIQATRDVRIGAAMCVGPLHVMPDVLDWHIAATRWTCDSWQSETVCSHQPHYSRLFSCQALSLRASNLALTPRQQTGQQEPTHKQAANQQV